ncbi:sensor histidine kinase [Pseudonocardia abyssalis]|uniref:histidine kinase n=1 Tax=Pseudonocardia abyssalis TaxID=2792008 RepID=A0ABS6UMI8_9PSEU|nr:histidine kinase [Pseudonocardia abyssalis]MBW0117611.1 two-component sensor histidine kinase [Pseudonocardia abyssalis]MBW0133456.1 two-component sensor histidine kinase [Pseudonocardia abyssalis]
MALITRRTVHLLLGAVLLLPYVALGWLFVISADGLGWVELLVLLAPAVAIGVGVAFVRGVRALEIAAARALLGVDLPDPDADTWSARRRAAAWLLLNAVLGGAVALLVLVVVPVAAAFVLAPWSSFPPLPTGPAAFWTPPVGVLLLAVLGTVLAVVGAGVARLAPVLLGPSAAERMAAELAASRRAERALAQRNRLARELHDSVGHALTVTTLQAGAAARVLDSDPAFVARALDAIADAGRTALDELDHVLGLLRDGADEAPDRAPQPDLRDLDSLLASTRAAGVQITADVRGTPDTVPLAVSREAYRIVQESLTNAARHAERARLRVAVDPDAVLIELTNPVRAGGTPGGGRGITGMRERVAVLGGELTAGLGSGEWRVHARLPLAGSTV